MHRVHDRACWCSWSVAREFTRFHGSVSSFVFCLYCLSGLVVFFFRLIKCRSKIGVLQAVSGGQISGVRCCRTARIGCSLCIRETAVARNRVPHPHPACMQNTHDRSAEDDEREGRNKVNVNHHYSPGGLFWGTLSRNHSAGKWPACGGRRPNPGESRRFQPSGMFPIAARRACRCSGRARAVVSASRTNPSKCRVSACTRSVSRNTR